MKFARARKSEMDETQNDESLTGNVSKVDENRQLAA
jgi:hypothetical protein